MPVTHPGMLAAESKDEANPVVHAEGKEENDTVKPSPAQPSGGFSKTVEVASILLEAEAQARRSEGRCVAGHARAGSDRAKVLDFESVGLVVDAPIV